MKTEDLLNKYFEGETSCEEEKELRRRFAEDNLPEELEVYRSFFSWFDEEAGAYNRQKQGSEKRIRISRRAIYAISGFAASIFVLLAGNGLYRQFTSQPRNYVIIDGKQYTDDETIREHARMSFSDVSFTREDIFDNLFE